MLTIPVGKNDHVQGELGAPVILVEYGDYQCPHCGHAYPIVKRLQKHFGAKLAFAFRNFPLNEIHPDAELAAETAEFAGAHGQFWPMHDAIFENQQSLGGPLMAELADKLHLPKDELREALQAETYVERVKSDFIGGVRSGVNGTPTFFINGKRYEGSFEYEELLTAIQGQL
jgi:protein-disulfide isomerase